ncbi:hypothetical protein TNCT_196601 [Trichonephila clavata]|uniref:Uncharacterized protein n=1 Tax=Trichonephila clavata TaxID=2740835 RepID=A0A8X6HVI3_TRICU|nr:hypothetical protein TNCT_196601 [Trichonephila clavata]
MDLARAALFASTAAADCEITEDVPTPNPRKRLMEPGEIAALNKAFEAPLDNVEDKQPKETDESDSTKKPKAKSLWKAFKKAFTGLRKKSYPTIDPDEMLAKIERDRIIIFLKLILSTASPDETPLNQDFSTPPILSKCYLRLKVTSCSIFTHQHL